MNLNRKQSQNQNDLEYDLQETNDINVLIAKNETIVCDDKIEVIKPKTANKGKNTLSPCVQKPLEQVRIKAKINQTSNIGEGISTRNTNQDSSSIVSENNQIEENKFEAPTGDNLD